jgi:hypothetical protein
MEATIDDTPRYYPAKLALTSISMLFFMVACVGYSDYVDVVKNVSWFQTVINDEGDRHYYGLSGVTSDGSADFHKYGNRDVCGSSGSGAFALTIIAALSATGALIVVSRRAKHSTGKLLSLAFFSVLSAGIAVGVFMNQCLPAHNSGQNFAWGPGAALTLVGMLLMLVVVVLTSIPVERGELKTGFQGGFNTSVHPDRPGYQPAAAVSAAPTTAVHEPREPTATPDADARLHRVTSALTCISVIFFIVGCLGFSDNIDVLANTSWFQIYSNGGKNRSYFGLMGVAYINEDEWDQDSGLSRYARCSGFMCEECASSGAAAFALTILATLCAVSVLSVILRRAKLNAVLIPAFASALLAAIAVCVFMERCFGRAQDNSQIAWGPGAILTLVGMILMLLVGGLASRSATGGDPSVRPGFGFKTDFQPDHYASSVAVAVAATSSGTREF